MNEDDERPIHINAILNMTVVHSKYISHNTISKSNKLNLDKQNIEKQTAII